MAEYPQNSETAPHTNARYTAAVATAAVAGVFSLAVAGLLTANVARANLDDPLASAKLAALKAELADRRNDETLKQQIRQLDHQLRVEFFRRQLITRRGGCLLLGGIVIFLVGLKYAAHLRPKLPHPAGKPSLASQRAAAIARWSVTAAGATLGCAAMAWALAFADPLEGADRLGLKKLARQTQPVAAAAAWPTAEEVRGNWPRFRGPGGSGISACANVPARWDGLSGENILWKTPVPLPGHNSPIVWGDRVFAAGADEHRREVYCFDAASGELLWRGQVQTAGGDKQPGDVATMGTGYAAATAVTDGRRVYAIFANGDIACFDLAGVRLWAKDLGVPENQYGHASSLATWRNLLLVLYDQGDGEGKTSRLMAIDGASGKIVWQKWRSVPASWASPIVIRAGQTEQIITAADPWVIAYDPADGKEIWRAECLYHDVAPSPIFAGGLVLAVQSGGVLAAIRPDGRGDVTQTHVEWKVEDGLPNICSPLSDGKRVWLVGEYGTLTCLDATDGRRLWEEDLSSSFRSSPSLAGGRIYLTDENGLTLIVEAAADYKPIARANLHEKCSASFAFADGRIFIRGDKNLYCIGSKPQ